MPRGGWLDLEEPADERALDFAGRLARFGMKGKSRGHPGDPDRIAGWEQGHVDSGFHARGIFLRGLLDRGLLARDRNAVDETR